MERIGSTKMDVQPVRAIMCAILRLDRRIGRRERRALRVEQCVIGGDGLGFVDIAGVFTDLNFPEPGIPEPSSWAMMLIGFFGIGGVIRRARRRRKVTDYHPAAYA